jgi:outer membrane receptor protein involved in Fe transport
MIVPSLLAAALALEAPIETEPPIATGPITDVAPIDESAWVQSVTWRRQRIEDVPQPVTVLDAADLDRTPAVTLPDRLRYEAGVDVYRTRSGQYDVGLRGYNGILNSRVLVAVGERQFRQEEFGAPIWSGTLFATDIDQVLIAKGPASVAYGANAFGGVIAIEERRPGTTVEALTAAWADSDGGWNLDATALGPLAGPLYFKASAGATRLTDLPATQSGLPRTNPPLSGPYDDDDVGAKRYDALLGVRLPHDTAIEVRTGGTAIDPRDLLDDLDLGVNDTETSYRDWSVRALAPWGRIVWLHRDAEQIYLTQKADDGQPPYRYTRGAFEDAEDILRANVDATLGAHRLGLGAEFSTWRSDSNLWTATGRFEDPSTWDRAEHRNRAVFAEDQWAAFPDLQLTAGVRLDDHNRFGTNWSPRLAANWRIDREQFAVFALSSGYRLPTPIESDLSEYYFASDPDLRAERIAAAELGWQLRRRGGLRLAANGFVNRANDLVWRLPLPADTMQSNLLSWVAAGDQTRPPGPFFAFTNYDNPAWTYGAELGAEAQALPPLRLWGNLTWQQRRFEQDVVLQSTGFANPGLPGQGATLLAFDENLGRDIDAPPAWKCNLGGDWEDPSGLTAHAALRWVSERRAFSFANSYFLRGDVAVIDVPAYTALDLACGWRFGRSDRYLRLSVLDVFDSEHVEGSETPASVLAAEHEIEDVARVGREVVLQGGWAF